MGVVGLDLVNGITNLPVGVHTWSRRLVAIPASRGGDAAHRGGSFAAVSETPDQPNPRLGAASLWLLRLVAVAVAAVLVWFLVGAIVG